MARDLLVHQRLREGRLVPFVVPPAAVADQVDQEVALELRAVGDRQPRRSTQATGSSAFDVDDRDLEARAPGRSRTTCCRSRAQSAVNPSWLLTMMWIVPPVS
jgi:hypothetical protein